MISGRGPALPSFGPVQSCKHEVALAALLVPAVRMLLEVVLVFDLVQLRRGKRFA